MLAFFIAMTSRLVVRHEANEIAILKSRGARSRQVFLAYLLEGLLLSAAAVAVGPPAGYLLCRIIGAANGFLEFVQRAALPLRLEGRAYLAAAGCALLLTATMLAPAWSASRTTIVLHKQRRSRGERKPLWRRAFLDVVAARRRRLRLVRVPDAAEGARADGSAGRRPAPRPPAVRDLHALHRRGRPALPAPLPARRSSSSSGPAAGASAARPVRDVPRRLPRRRGRAVPDAVPRDHPRHGRARRQDGAHDQPQRRGTDPLRGRRGRHGARGVAHQPAGRAGRPHGHAGRRTRVGLRPVAAGVPRTRFRPVRRGSRASSSPRRSSASPRPR